MIVRDLSEYRAEDGSISIENRIRATIDYGLGWYGDMQAQDFITSRLQKILDNEHTLLRNVPLAGTNLSAPMILLGPQGVRLIHASRIRGIFRAKDEDWQKFDGRLRRFKSTRPNIQLQALSMARGILRYLQAQGFPLPELEAVMIFANPQTHVDMAAPAAKIVLADAIDHFASNLLEMQPIMDQEDIIMVAEALTNPQLPEPEPEPEPGMEAEEIEGMAEAGVAEGEIFSSEPLMPMETRREFEPVRRIRGLTMRQLALLGAMAFFELLIIGALVLMLIGDRFLP